jgi:hypothetical protein
MSTCNSRWARARRERGRRRRSRRGRSRRGRSRRGSARRGPRLHVFGERAELFEGVVRGSKDGEGGLARVDVVGEEIRRLERRREG